MAKKKYKFWKENQLDQECELTEDEIKEKYLKYLESKEKEWIEYYISNLVTFFIADGIDGLNSTSESETVNEIENFLRPVRDKFMGWSKL